MRIRTILLSLTFLFSVASMGQLNATCAFAADPEENRGHCNLDWTVDEDGNTQVEDVCEVFGTGYVCALGFGFSEQ